MLVDQSIYLCCCKFMERVPVEDGGIGVQEVALLIRAPILLGVKALLSELLERRVFALLLLERHLGHILQHYQT